MSSTYDYYDKLYHVPTITSHDVHICCLFTQACGKTYTYKHQSTNMKTCQFVQTVATFTVGGTVVGACIGGIGAVPGTIAGAVIGVVFASLKQLADHT